MISALILGSIGNDGIVNGDRGGHVTGEWIGFIGLYVL